MSLLIGNVIWLALVCIGFVMFLFSQKPKLKNRKFKLILAVILATITTLSFVDHIWLSTCILLAIYTLYVFYLAIFKPNS